MIFLDGLRSNYPFVVLGRLCCNDFFNVANRGLLCHCFAGICVYRNLTFTPVVPTTTPARSSARTMVAASTVTPLIFQGRPHTPGFTGATVAHHPVTTMLIAALAFTQIAFIMCTAALAFLTVYFTCRDFAPNITTVKAAVPHTKSATRATILATSSFPVVYPSATIMVITCAWGTTCALAVFATRTVLAAAAATATLAI